MAALPLVLISAISNAVLSLQLCVMNLTALESPEKTTETTSILDDAQGFKKEN